MATDTVHSGGIRITDTDGESGIFTPSGDGLVINMTSADEEDKIDLLLTPTDLDALLDIVSIDALSEALIRRAGIDEREPDAYRSGWSPS